MESLPLKMHGPLRIHDLRLSADPSRVVLQPFHLSWQAKDPENNRALQLVNDIASLPEHAAAQVYGSLLAEFKDRHLQIEALFTERWIEISALLQLDAAQFSETRQKLIGAYFCHEYSYAAAALMNPSIVPHPDQTGCEEGARRFILSLRAVGEGHISSLAFREGVVLKDDEIRLRPQNPLASSVLIEKDAEEHHGGPVVVNRRPDASLSNTVILPITPQQRNGLEDLRLVQFEHEGGQIEWIGTYTAYSGSDIRSELLRTPDFKRFSLEPITGRAGRNKGMALFPRKVGGNYLMVGRQDGKNLYLLRSENLTCWDDEGVLLMEPRYPWEFIQIGNCGSPIETEHGWLLLTHGVGAMRKYTLGCALLDLENPAKLIARTPAPLLTAESSDRSGYVPNVIYTCGAMLHGEELIIPYGISDSSVGFASIALDDLLKTMQ